MELLKKGFALFLVIIIISSTGMFFNSSMAANSKAEEAIDASIEDYDELTAGYGMTSLNQAPVITFSIKNKIIYAKVEDGSGMIYDDLSYNDSNAKSDSKDNWNTSGDNVIKTKTFKFEVPDKNKSKTITIKAKDTKGLSSKIIAKVSNKNNKYSVDTGMRIKFSYSANQVHIILKDYAGIDQGKASVEIFDKNNNNKSIGKVTASNMKTKYITKYDGKIINGIVSFDISKLKKDKNGKYCIKAKVLDAHGIVAVREARFIIDKTVKKATKDTSRTKKQTKKSSSGGGDSISNWDLVN